MNREPFYWLTEHSNNFLYRGYLSEGETPKTRIRDIANHAQKLLDIEGFADKFYDYMSKGYYSLSSPVWSNFGKARGLGVSCFGSHTADSVPGILKTVAEIGIMSKLGGGTACYLGDVRPRGSSITDNGQSTGTVHFMELFQATTDVIAQGSQRRGRTAAYLPIDHGDIEEFLKVATEGHPVQNMTTAVVVPSNWMQEMIDGDKSKRAVWAKVLKARSEIGFPYILYKDNANNHTKPDVYTDKGLDVNHSQLCSEIMLNTDADHSFVCVLSSMNLLHYDEWKDTDAVETLTYFLDAVVTDFLNDLESYRDSLDPDKRETFSLMERAYKFAKRERALGVGVLGWHSLLQSKLIPFESRDAAKLNLEIAKLMKQRTYKASRELAQIYGEPELLVGYGRRNSALLATAPTTSSAFILGQVSQSIEPLFSNYYIKDLAKAKVAIKNVYLEKVLEERGYNTKTVWDNIMSNDGSVYGLSDEVLPEELKSVFKTFREISQEAVIDQAAARQEYIDQGQSLNLMITNDLSPKEINALHIRAWQLGIKSLYYQHSVNQSQEFARSRRNETCVACEG
jgi:ribonucleoside-diphosphate reductase alpha chain